METKKINEESVSRDLRRYERVFAKEEAFAAFVTENKNYYMHFGQILDMSIGGIGIKYSSKNGSYQQNEFVLVELFGQFSTPSYGIFRCRVAYNFVLEKDPWSSLILRRCGLQFMGLQSEQIHKIQRFIEIYSKVD